MNEQSTTPPRWLLMSASSAAPMCAAVCTNPIDNIKTRLQLQGELSRSVAQGSYTGWVDAFRRTLATEGPRGLQRGLSSSLLREGSMNFFKLGLVEPLRSLIHPEPTPVPAWKNFLVGSIAGAIGGAVCNPFEITKVRFQAMGAAGVANQAQYSSLRVAFRAILRDEGPQGFLKGISTSTLRLTVGAGLSTGVYFSLKPIALDHGWSDTAGTHFTVTLVSSLISVLGINPMDVARTRLYNQPIGKDGRGLMYSGGIDCASKILRAEGPMAFYKGWFSHFMRLGPHLCLTFVIWEQMKKQANAWWGSHMTRGRKESLARALRPIFDKMDQNHDGVLQEAEILEALRDFMKHSSHMEQFDMQQSAKEMLAQADANRDGVVSFSELLELVYTHESFAVDRLLNDWRKSAHTTW